MSESCEDDQSIAVEKVEIIKCIRNLRIIKQGEVID